MIFSNIKRLMIFPWSLNYKKTDRKYLTFPVRHASSCFAELHHISKNEQDWQYWQNNPCHPTAYFTIFCHNYLPSVAYQHKLFHKVVDTACDHGCPYKRCGHNEETLLPSHRQKTEYQTQTKQHSKRYPSDGHMIECLNNKEDGNPNEKAKTKTSQK